VLRKFYDWVMNLAHHRQALWALAAVSFAESSFFPIPPDAMLIPMVLADRKKAWLYAGVCTAASVAGALLGYWIGYELYATVGQWIIKTYGVEAKVQESITAFNEYGLWIILIKGLTPIPYKIVTIASGIAHFALAPFILASIVTRGCRFFLVAALLYRFGQPIRDFIEKRLTLVTTAFVAIVIGGFVALKYIG
jgi:membrane protein YqaA with SNARE-associated domain